jgi:hypothetical protein
MDAQNAARVTVAEQVVRELATERAITDPTEAELGRASCCRARTFSSGKKEDHACV